MSARESCHVGLDAEGGLLAGAAIVIGYQTNQNLMVAILSFWFMYSVRFSSLRC